MEKFDTLKGKHNLIHSRIKKKWQDSSFPKYGYGNTNDGNSSRKFFAENKVTSEITGMDDEIIKRLGVILNILNCKEKINGSKFGEYATKTAELLMEKYPGKKLTPTLHKILAHGQTIIEYHCLPIGEMSEEAQESRNKDYKKFRAMNTCKISRSRENEDLFNMLAASSDPLIASLRHVKFNTELTSSYSNEMLSLLDIPSNVNVDDYFTKNY